VWGFLTAVVGVVATIIGVALGARLNTRAQDRRWIAEQESLYARERAQRLRGLYARMAQSAATLQAVVYERNWVTTADVTVEKRDERHAAMLKEAERVISEVGGDIIVELAIASVRDTYRQLRKAVQEYQVAEALEPPGPGRVKKIRDLEQRIGKLTLEVGDQALAHLSELDVPPEIEARPRFTAWHPIESWKAVRTATRQPAA
jgi:hypothetical protein